jgi:hypothetical protein
MSLNRNDWKRIGWTFVQAGAAVLIAGALSWLNDGVAFDYEALGVAAIAAGISAVKNFLLGDEHVAK